MQIEPISEHRCHLGEGPLWDHATRSLFWVDSLGPTLYRYDFITQHTETWTLPGRCVGSLAVHTDDELIIAMDQGFYRFSLLSQALQLIAKPLADGQDQRFNDGKVDPWGNFVAGTMNLAQRQAPDCSMFRLHTDLRCQQLLGGFECFNGPCFAPDGEHIYFTGRRSGVIECASYDPLQGLGETYPLLTGVNPDGATVDAEGYLWTAQWSDECLLRVSPGGEVTERLIVPGQIVTSVMFGGPELDNIYVTTLGKPLHSDVPKGVDAGATFVIRETGYQGRKEPRFGG